MADSENREPDVDVADDQTVSMVDVLNDEQQLQEDAAAVLGACDDSVCTYSQGYMPRQALYACVKCSPADSDPAGVCLACSLTCHDGHQLTELYTKRKFRCDCGNSKFSGVMTCKLCPDKEPLNENMYNHNFQGLYCTCCRPYPDTEDSVDDVMLQCVICEDWFHGRHLGVEVVPDEDDFDEVVCQKCLERCHFIRLYANDFPGLAVTAGVTVVTAEVSTVTAEVSAVSADAEVDVVATDDVIHSSSSAVVVDAKEASNAAENEAGSDVRSSLDAADGDTDACHTDATTAMSADAEHVCLLHQLSDTSQHPTVPAASKSGAVFWKSSWRQHLCRCASCMALYERLHVAFLLDESDTIVAYEERGKQKTASAASSYQQGIDAFISSLGRVQQIELLQGYSELKVELVDYLKKFVENGKVVREEDIAEFFEQLTARKRQKTSQSAVQYYCK